MASGNYAAVKAAMIADINASLKDEGPAESALSGAPANVQAAMKGLFSFVGSYKTAIANSTSITQLATSIVSLAGTSQVEADGLTVANYVTAQCGTTTTTTAIPALSEVEAVMAALRRHGAGGSLGRRPRHSGDPLATDFERVPHGGIASAERAQLVMRSHLHRLTVVQHDDAVGRPGGLQPMGDDDRGPVARQPAASPRRRAPRWPGRDSTWLHRGGG